MTLSQRLAPGVTGPRERVALGLYRLAWWLATPVAMAYLGWRARRQPAYRHHWGERWCLPGGPVPRVNDSAPVWVHAVSVGETRAAVPLIEALLTEDPARWVLLTHMTPTGRETGQTLIAERWPERVRQAYLPYDLGVSMARFLRCWRPRLGILMETELWPSLCHEARRAGVPLALVNARLSARSQRKGERWRSLIEPALRSLALVQAQTPADAARLRALGGASVGVMGNLKFDQTPAAEGVERGRAWRAAIGSRPVVLMASSREGEEALVLGAWRELVTDAPPGPRLLVVPRHPQRFDEVARLLAAAGGPVARRSADWPAPAAPLALGDSMGEMSAYYAMADVAIIGGSLLPFGAQNLIEACALGVPVIVGPHSHNFAQVAEEAIAAGAAIRVADAREAVAVAVSLLADPARRATMGKAGIAFAQAHRGATRRCLQALRPWLDDGPVG